VSGRRPHIARAAAALAGIALVGSLAASPPRASPEGYARGPAELLGRFDGDGDGRVVEQEYVDYLALGFTARDVDGSGVLDGGELPPGARPIPRAENEARLRRQFARQDANRDGHLDARELLAPPRA
jgi:hypothetical protein